MTQTTKQLWLTAAVSALMFLALNAWSAQLEINHYEETARRLHAITGTVDYHEHQRALPANGGADR